MFEGVGIVSSECANGDSRQQHIGVCRSAVESDLKPGQNVWRTAETTGGSVWDLVISGVGRTRDKDHPSGRDLQQEALRERRERERKRLQEYQEAIRHYEKARASMTTLAEKGDDLRYSTHRLFIKRLDARNILEGGGLRIKPEESREARRRRADTDYTQAMGEWGQVTYDYFRAWDLKARWSFAMSFLG